MGHTAYTHQFRMHPETLKFAMGSAHSIEDVQAIEALGGRAFLIMPKGSTVEDLPQRTIFCPQPENKGVVTCRTCGLCDGKPSPSDKRKHIAIIEH